MLTTPRSRIAALALLIAVLTGMLVAHGTVGPDPDRHRYPDLEVLSQEGDTLVGDRVVLSGTAVETNPVVLSGSPGARPDVIVVLTGVERDVDRGDDLWIAGTVQSDYSVSVTTAIVRSPWELRYMYVVSAIGGLWVLRRFVREWRFDRDRLAFVPRTDRRGDGADVREVTD